MHRRAPQLHHRLAVWLLTVRSGYLPNFTFHAVLGAGKRQGAAPLSCTGLSGELGYALGVVVVGLEGPQCWACETQQGLPPSYL